MTTQNKTEQLQVRVTQGQKELIRQAAKRAGMDMSGWILQRALPDVGTEFFRLVDQVKRYSESPSYALAELHDWLEGLSPHEFRRAVAEAPPSTRLNAYLENYVAAMIEVAAHRKHCLAPAWTMDIKPLEEPVFGVSLIGVRLLLLVNSPPPFRRRNVFIDATIGDRV